MSFSTFSISGYYYFFEKVEIIAQKTIKSFMKPQVVLLRVLKYPEPVLL
jgi:hypothetical protein